MFSWTLVAKECSSRFQNSFGLDFPKFLLTVLGDRKEKGTKEKILPSDYASVLGMHVRNAWGLKPQTKMDLSEVLAIFLDEDVEVAAKKRERAEEDEEPAKKKKKGADAETWSSTTWADRLRQGLAEQLQRRGRQMRELVVASSCTGLGSHCKGLEERLEGNARQPLW